MAKIKFHQVTTIESFLLTLHEKEDIECEEYIEVEQLLSKIEIISNAYFKFVKRHHEKITEQTAEFAPQLAKWLMSDVNIDDDFLERVDILQKKYAK